MHRFSVNFPFEKSIISQLTNNFLRENFFWDFAKTDSSTLLIDALLKLSFNIPKCSREFFFFLNL